MSVYLINSYDIIDMDKFQSYPPKVIPLLEKYGAEVIASDVQAVALEGQPKTMNAIIKFPSEEAVLRCYHDPQYQAIRNIRLSTSENCTMVIVKSYSDADN